MTCFDRRNDLRALSVGWFDGLAAIFALVEESGFWPDHLLDAYVFMSLSRTYGTHTHRGTGKPHVRARFSVVKRQRFDRPSFAPRRFTFTCVEGEHTQCLSSGEVLFDKALKALLKTLTLAIYEAELENASLLRSYPRTAPELLGLADTGLVAENKLTIPSFPLTLSLLPMRSLAASSGRSHRRASCEALWDGLSRLRLRLNLRLRWTTVRV